MRTARTIVATIAAALLVSAGMVAASPAHPALATAAQCSGGANGFVDISDSLTGTNASVSGNPMTHLDGLNVNAALQFGTVAGAQRGWAHIWGSTINGDQVWMDWSEDGGSTVHVRCGPWVVGSTGMSKTSAAKATSSSNLRRFRACARLMFAAGLGPTHCTGWW